jgi:STE24 endopeptidase
MEPLVPLGPIPAAAAAFRLDPKLDPGKLEELLFFDHPSGRNRTEMATRWKAEHMRGPEAAQPH